jgi:hypothetical protein
MSGLRSWLPSSELLIVFVIGMGVSSFVLLITLRRLGRVRFYMYSFGVLATLVVLSVARLTGRLSSADFIKAAALHLFVDAWLLGALMFKWETDVLADPSLRQDRGLPQYEGKSPRAWFLLIIVSPVHLLRYRRYVLDDPDSPSRGLLSKKQ